MGIEVLADSGIVQFINWIEHFLHYFSILAVTPVLVFVLLFLIIPGLFIIKDRLDNKKLVKKIHIAVFRTAKYVYRLAKVDESAEVPRFIVFGYIAPISFTYLILYIGIMVAINMFYRFWSAALSSAKEKVPCDNSSSPNTTDCVNLSIDINGGISAAVSLFLAIVFVYSFTLEILLKVSGAKQSCQLLTGGASRSKRCFLRVTITIMDQIFFVFIAKFAFIAYFITNDFDGSISLFNDANGYTSSLLIDVVCFAMLTPWCLFEKIKLPKENEQEMEMEKSDICKRMDETSIEDKP